MSQVFVGTIDKRIIAHLGEGGTIDDPIGDALANQLVTEALKNERIASAATDQMLTQSDLVFVYKHIVKSMHPDHFISIGFRPILAASAVFFHVKTFLVFVEFISTGSNFSLDPLDPFDLETRRGILAENGWLFCKKLYVDAALLGKTRDAEWAYKKTTNFSPQRQGRGCASLILVGLFVLVCVVSAVVIIRK